MINFLIFYYSIDIYFWNFQIFQFKSVRSLSCVWLFATPWIAACQASLSFTISWSSLKLTSIKSVMPFSHLILCRPLLLLPPPAPGLLWLYLKLTILMDLHGMSSCSPLQIHILSPLFDFFVVVFLVYHFFVMATQPNNQKLFCYAPEVFGNPPIGSLKESLFVIFLELKLYKYIYLNKVLP